MDREFQRRRSGNPLFLLRLRRSKAVFRIPQDVRHRPRQNPYALFRFLALLGDLGECAFTQVVHYRTADVSKMDKETRRTYMMMKRKYGLPQPESDESREFMEKLREVKSD